MLKIGDKDAKGLYYGSSTVVKAFWGSKQVWPSLPYDAEVEWLQSTGTQWIETPIYISYREDFEVFCEGQIINNMRTVWVGDYQLPNYTHFSVEIGGTSNSRPYWTRAYCQPYPTAWDRFISQRSLNEVVTISITYNATTRVIRATDGIAT